MKLVSLLILALLATPPALAQPPAAPAPIELGEVSLEPAQPAADTLCKLRVTLKNGSARMVSSLRFEVRLNGQPLTVYSNQAFLEKLAPGASQTVQLYNFWTTETGRPAAVDGRLTVEVRLVAARYLAGSKDAQGNDVWQLEEAVPGLPVSATRTVTLARR
ncbi:MAG TPA: hypothetical protein VF017_05735 [Thermoanaerobaculia bacterium]|nr:hypothetical protein [Thermoanaerobaculia bacterium]